MAEEFEHILDQCIDRLLQGESLEQCLQRYPEQAAQLEPLLRVALAAQKASAVEPRPEFKAQARYQMRSLLYAGKRKSQPRRIPVLGWLPRWATAAVIGVLFVLVAGSGTVAAASDSLPGEILYSVKMATERVQFAFTFSDEGTARLHAKFAARRAEEMARLAEGGHTGRVAGLVSRFEDHLEAIEDLAASSREREPGDVAWLPELRQRLQQNAVRDATVLEGAERRAPEPARPFITHARGMLAERYQAAVEALNNSQD
ncbi:MAG: hypothetical protein ISS53_00505 [Dehalococcoidia bacterium]|nr:hypothetical protein [Dehalococcoidia bacterium]